MLQFYLVRHGKTESNEQSIIMGARIDSPLSDSGVKNAENIGEKLKGIKFNHIYSSDLGRSFITAYLIAKKLEILNLITMAPQLREVDYGDFTYQSKVQVKKDCPAYKNDPDFQFPGGESFRELQQRAVNFVKNLEQQHPDGKVLIVSHAGAIRGINAFFRKLDLAQNLEMPISHEYIGHFTINNGDIVSYFDLSK